MTIYRSIFRAIILLMITVSVRALKNDSCISPPKCSCDFTSIDSMSTTKAEILAGTVGALSPLLAVGAGVGIYKLIKGSSGSVASGFQRAPSDMTDDSSQGVKQHTSPLVRQNSFNTLRRGSFNASRRGSSATILSVTDYDDWDIDSDRDAPSSFDQDDPRSYSGSPVSAVDVSTKLRSVDKPSSLATASIYDNTKKDNINPWMSF